MKTRWMCIAMVWAVTVTGIATVACAAPQSLKATLDGNQVSVTIEGKLFTAYKFDTAQKYPYFWPVNGPASGQSVTTETSEPYPHHHSLFFGCDRVNGGNYCRTPTNEARSSRRGPN